MSDLAQQIRDRLDGFGPMPALKVGYPEPWTPEQREKWAAAFKAEVAKSMTEPMKILPPGPKVYPGFEQMRDAILGVLDEHQPVPCGNVRHDRRDGLHCAVCEYDDIERSWWPCPTVRVIAEKLRIEMDHA